MGLEPGPDCVFFKLDGCKLRPTSLQNVAWHLECGNPRGRANNAGDSKPDEFKQLSSGVKENQDSQEAHGLIIATNGGTDEEDVVL